MPSKFYRDMVQVAPLALLALPNKTKLIKLLLATKRKNSLKTTRVRSRNIIQVQQLRKLWIQGSLLNIEVMEVNRDHSSRKIVLKEFSSLNI